MTDFSIILLNWNGVIDTLECVDSLKNSVYKRFHLIIVDNDSTVMNFTKLVSELSERFSIKVVNEFDIYSFDEKMVSFDQSVVYIIRNTENWGFAKGNNIGIKFVQLHNIKEVLLLNNDTLVTPSFLDKLISFSRKHPEYSALTPAICYSQPNEGTIWNCGGKLTWYGNRKYFYAGENYDTSANLKYFDITFITGCALFFRPGETGLLSEQFFFGEEDFEFSLRLFSTNQKMACVYDSLIYHKVGRSLSNMGEINLNALFLHYVSRLINLRNYYKSLYLYLITFLNILYGLYLLSIRFRYNKIKSIIFWYKLYKYSKDKESISKLDFDVIMSIKF